MLCLLELWNTMCGNVVAVQQHLNFWYHTNLAVLLNRLVDFQAVLWLICRRVLHSCQEQTAVIWVNLKTTFYQFCCTWKMLARSQWLVDVRFSCHFWQSSELYHQKMLYSYSTIFPVCEMNFIYFSIKCTFMYFVVCRIKYYLTCNSITTGKAKFEQICMLAGINCIFT